jgi:UDP-glucose 4-epimerase
MNILVTGGAGFIGSHTAVSLVEAGMNPILIDNFVNSNRVVLKKLEQITGRTLTCYEADCGDAEVLRSIIDKEKIEGVIHFAAHKAVGESMQQPLRYYRNNLSALITLLEVMVEKGVKNLIFSSSCTVYGEPEQLPVTEQTPVQPAISVYGNTKQVGEEILRDTVAAAAPLKIISLRYFNPIGAHPSALIGELPIGVPANLVPFVTQAAAGLRKSLTIFGDDYPTTDGSCIRDYIHVMDLAEAHVAALSKLAADGIEAPYYDIFNVGTGRGASVLEVVHAFEAVTGQKLPYTIGPRRPGDIPATYADVTKSTQELGWQAKRTLEEALVDAWRWQVALEQD